MKLEEQSVFEIDDGTTKSQIPLILSYNNENSELINLLIKCKYAKSSYIKSLVNSNTYILYGAFSWKDKIVIETNLLFCMIITNKWHREIRYILDGFDFSKINKIWNKIIL